MSELFDFSPPIHDIRAALFASAFPTVAPDVVQALDKSLIALLAGRPCTITTVGSLREYTADVPWALAEPDAEQARLRRILDDVPQLWECMRAALDGFASGQVLESALTTGAESWLSVCEDDIVRIATLRGLPATMIGVALAEIAMRPDLADYVSRSIAAYHLAMEYWESLRTWRQDFKCSRPTLLVHRITSRRPADVPDESSGAMARLATTVYFGGHARFVLTAALSHITLAEQAVNGLTIPEWNAQLARVRERINEALEQIDLAMAQRFRKRPSTTQLVGREASTEWQQVALSALSYLLMQAGKGFPEARHIMHVPRSRGFSVTNDFQSGDVFQRAVIGDALCDAAALSDTSLSVLLDDIVDYVISLRAADGVGGWRYLPGVPELPPDADDLAQVIQLLIRCGRRGAIDRYVTEPLRALFSDCAYADGSFESWIIPRMNRSLIEERQHKQLTFLCFTPPAFSTEGQWCAPEVMANLLYALSMYSPGDYQAQVERAMDFLEHVQQPDGSWPAVWYTGPYYGTYVCLRAFAALRPGSSVIKRGFTFVKESQRQDGGWGHDDETSNPLETSLGILSIEECARVGVGGPSGIHPSIDRAKGCLMSGITGGWPKCDWLYMGWNIAPHGSRSITTAYVLKAALAGDRLTRTHY